MNRLSWGTTLNTILIAAVILYGEVQAIPQTFHAEYILSSKGMVLGETTYDLTHIPAEQRERLTIHTEPTGLAALFVKKIINEESIWEWHNGEIRPLHYRYDRTGKREKHRSRQFDWEKRTVTLTDNGDSRELNQLQPNTVDEALFLLALMHDLEQGNRNLEYKVAKSSHWSDYVFTAGEVENVTVPAGEFSAIRTTRQKEGKITFELWSAPDLDHLPVQIEYREKDGTLFSLRLRSSSLQ